MRDGNISLFISKSFRPIFGNIGLGILCLKFKINARWQVNEVNMFKINSKTQMIQLLLTDLMSCNFRSRRVDVSFYKKSFPKNMANLRENISTGVFFISFCFPVNFTIFLKNFYFEEHQQMTASVIVSLNIKQPDG